MPSFPRTVSYVQAHQRVPTISSLTRGKRYRYLLGPEFQHGLTDLRQKKNRQHQGDQQERNDVPRFPSQRPK